MDYKKLLAATLVIAGATRALHAETSPAVMPEVVVSGNNKKSYTSQDLSLNKYRRPLIDTPQSISVISPQLLEDQHVTTLRDAVRNVAGVSIAAGEGGNQGDSLTLRGFSARSDIFLDGMRDFGSYYRDAFNWERVEVLKGPSSIAFGRGSTGGVVNQVSKVPEKTREGFIGTTFGTNGKKRVDIDFSEPYLNEGDGIAFRVNAFQENSQVAGRDVVQTNHSGFAPTLMFGLGTPTRITLSFFHESSSDIPDYGIPWLFDKPAPVNLNNYYGFKTDYLKTNADVSTFKIEHDLDANTTITDQLRYGQYTRDMRATEPRIATGTTPATPINSIVASRNEINTNSVETFLQNQLDLRTKLMMGTWEHSLTLGTEIGIETSAPTRYTITGVPATNLANPNPNQNFTGSYTAPVTTKVAMNSQALYFVDTIKLNEQWEVTGGTRWDLLQTSFDNGTLMLSSNDSIFSYRGAIVHKPVENGSFYVAYGNSFNPSSEALSLSASTASLAPEQNITVEAGTKWDLFDKNLSLRSAVFRTEKLNARETDPNNSAVTVLAGNQEVKGFEFELAGQLSEKWRTTVAYALLQSRVMSSQFFPAAIGSPLANVPQNTFTIWSTYDLNEKWQIGGGANFVDSRRSSSTVPNDPTTGLPKELPSYWVANAMTGYHVNDKLDFQLNFNNIFDNRYYDQIHPGHIVPGETRSMIASLKYRF